MAISQHDDLTDSDIARIANEALFGGNYAQALVYSSLALQSDQGDWAVVRYATAAAELTGAVEAANILNRFNSNKRQANYQIARIHYFMLVGQKSLALAELTKVLELERQGKINLRYLVSAFDLVLDNAAQASKFIAIFSDDILTEAWCLNALLKKLRRAENSEELLASLVERGASICYDLPDDVKNQLAFLTITLGRPDLWRSVNMSSDSLAKKAIVEFRQFHNSHNLQEATELCREAMASAHYVDPTQLIRHIKKAVASGSAFSFVRVGDGEGRFLIDLQEYPSILKQAREVAKRIWFWNSEAEPTAEFFDMLKEAFKKASVVGINPPQRIALESRNNLLGYVGVVGGNKFVFDNKKNGSITENWNNEHLAQTGFFQDLVSELRQANKKLCIISPYSDFKSRVGFLNHDFIDTIVIPSDGHSLLRKVSIETPHYPNAFGEVIRSLNEARETVFFVAAGVFGKIYCHKAMKAGNVAIDIGSVMDKWMQIPTR